MMNRTMKLLMLSDIFVLTGFGLIQPILAIFINGDVTGGTVFTAGLASTIFLVIKSLVQLPFGRYIDSHTRKTRWLMVGTMLMAGVPILYLSADSIHQIYLAEAIYGLGSGLAYPTWLGLWSTNMDKGRESFQWSIYSTSTGLGTAATGTLGAAIASIMGFNATFIFAGLMCLLGCFTLLILEKMSARETGTRAEDHELVKVQRTPALGSLVDLLKL
jgi:DHA1 family quinolone resistance protein-like MFS transporter